MKRLRTGYRLWLTLLAAGAGVAQTSTPVAPSADAPPLAHAHALADQAEWAQAEAVLKSYLGDHESSAEGHYLLAYVLFRENQPLASLTESTKGARTQPPTPEQLSTVALDYVLINDYPDADKWMSKVTEETPADSEAWYRLGRIKYTENRFQESIHCFNEALTLAPRSVKAENNLGLAYEGLNQIDKAMAAYRTAIAWQADASHPSEQPLVNLGLVLLDRSETGEALPLLEQAVKIAPNDARIRVALGRLYRTQNRLQDAQAELERAVTLEPKTAAYHFLLGQVYQKQGLTEKARAEFAQAATMKAAQPAP